ncbi:hypothetical protein V5739_05515 [Salinimicrobium sp. TIG7-5_MAKvit]|uniref:hypothetical protein n=1 Tax=Salinimicrobium sp. TIG7-5_MAKvit TaxID=3121289 RepID=UPI003C6E091C
MTLTEYLNEIEFASTKILEAIWNDNHQAEQLKSEIEKEAKIVEEEYQRSLAMQQYAEDPDDVMLGVGRYWDNYFGKDKDLYHKNDKLQNLQKRLTAHEFSIVSLCGNLLEHAKKGLSIVYGSPKNWPCGRIIGSQCLSNIIFQSRNQSTHYEEAIKDGGFRNKNIEMCFNQLENEIDNTFSDYTSRDMAFDIVKLLEWKDFNSFKADLETMV